MTIIGLDFESYSAANLPEVGLHNYINDPTFKVLIAAVAEVGMQTLVLDFVNDYSKAVKSLLALIGDNKIAAHNAAFEQAVLKRIGIYLPSDRFIDSAVLARACGYGSSLEAAAPQVLGIDKVESGKNLIQLFSIPGELQEIGNSDKFNPIILEKYPLEWDQFGYYCQVDAELSLRLVDRLLVHVNKRELDYTAITLDMNNVGWPVDLGLVKEMRRRYQDNVAMEELKFQTLYDAEDLNLNSHKQLVEWCTARGVRATSFDEKHVAKLIAKLEKRIAALDPANTKRLGYEDVIAMLRTKQVLGGSSLKKLDTILNQSSWQGRLYDQYLHIGAGQSWRTTGRGVQMQNLKRLMGEGDNVEELNDPAVHWNNAKMARNLRQVFAPANRQGRLIVGDFASVESRGLAWQADEQWKLEAYRKGEDLYKVQAGLIYGVEPGLVSKDQRQTGKVGELACGYGAGPEAVRAFAEGMGVDLSEGEATDLVRRWRMANPEIVGYWKFLDEGIHAALLSGVDQNVGMESCHIRITPLPAPESLRRQTQDMGLQSLWFEMWDDNRLLLTRVVHGAHIKGRNVGYWKPSERKTGDLWTDRFTDPKTGLTRHYSLYGGKLAGILTQSLCREVFFSVLKDVAGWVDTHPNLHLIGQFHDEIVLEWEPYPTGIGLDSAMAGLEVRMSKTPLPGFPLAAAVKADYRYTK